MSSKHDFKTRGIDMTTNKKLSLALLPTNAIAVLLMGIAANHPQAGAFTQALFVLIVLAFCVQLWAAGRHA